MIDFDYWSPTYIAFGKGKEARAGELVREMHDVDEKTFAKFCAGLGAEQTAQLCAMLDHMIENVCGGCADGGGQK